MAVVHCPGCRSPFTLGDDRLGQSLECPRCRASFAATLTPPLPAADAPAGTFAQTPEQEAAAAASSAPDTDAVPGYEMLGELGRGGMGVVYRARDLRLNREVALKMILHADASRATVARFWAEAEVMAAVRHPHVVGVYELGEHAGRPFMAMEFVSGGSLADRLARGPLSPREAAELLAKVAAGVGAAHDAGIVHRDLKPGNVMLDAGGEPKVMDFGIAKRKAHDLTQTNAMMGTPAYMAPEQAAAKAKYVGPPADVWALGVMLYECVSGKRPFEGESVWVVLEKIVSDSPPALRTVSRVVPRDLETVVTKCLSKEAEHRYATAGELAADLERFARGEPIAARRVGTAERVARWVRRKPTAAAAWGFSSLAVLLAGVVFVVFGFYREAESQRATAEDAKKDVEVARDGEKRARLRAEDFLKTETQLRGEADGARQNEEVAKHKAVDLAKRLAVFEYGRTVQVAHQDWRDNNILGARALLESTDPELRGWEWRYVHRLCNSSLLTFRGHTDGVNSASFSADGSRVVTASGDKTAKVWDARTGVAVLTLKGHTGGVFSASFSADGSRVVTASEDNTAKVWNARTGTEVFTLKGRAGYLTSASFSADGSRIVTAGSTAKVWDTNTGTEIRTLDGHTHRVSSASFSADGSRVVTASDDKTAKVWDANTGAELLILRGHAGGVSSASFSTDGSRIVTAGGTAKVWDANTGAEIMTLKGRTGLWRACFSADGARVVTNSDDNTAKVWDARSGAELLTLKGHTDRVSSASFRADGSRVVTGSSDRTARVWNANTGTEVLTLDGHDLGSVMSASFSADGARVVTGSLDDTAKVWDARTGAEIRALEGHTQSVFSASFSTDGARVVTASDDRTARVWDARTGVAVLTLKGHTGGVFSASFSADGSRVVTASGDNTAKLWDARTGAELLTLKGHTKLVWSASFSADGSRVVTGSWDGTARVWDANTEADLLTLKGHTDDVRSASFSADGSRVVTGSRDGTAKVWDAKTGAELLTLKGHTKGVSSASFSADGSRVVTGSDDKTAKVWEAKTGADLLTLKGHTDDVLSASFSADGSRVLTGSNDKTAKVWDAGPLDRDFLPRPLAPLPRAKP